jgi:hypothetical protein
MSKILQSMRVTSSVEYGPLLNQADRKIKLSQTKSKTKASSAGLLAIAYLSSIPSVAAGPLLALR